MEEFFSMKSTSWKSCSEKSFKIDLTEYLLENIFHQLYLARGIDFFFKKLFMTTSYFIFGYLIMNFFLLLFFKTS